LVTFVNEAKGLGGRSNVCTIGSTNDVMDNYLSQKFIVPFFSVELSTKIVVQTICKCLRMTDKCLISFSYTSPDKKLYKFTIKFLIFYVGNHFSVGMLWFNSIQNHSIPLKGLGGFANKSEDEGEELRWCPPWPQNDDNLWPPAYQTSWVMTENAHTFKVR
jgi:hypothetical protein